MREKVILLLVDGMRPDAMTQCGHPFAQRLLSLSAHSLKARTVFPSVTLPCHMSLFHSVDPARHGVTTNTFVPQVRPIDGLVERLAAAGRKCAFFYTWGELRDLCRPGLLHTSCFLNQHHYDRTDDKITDAALAYIAAEKPDFVFLYLGETDEVGHDHGWMEKEYLACAKNALGCAERVWQACGGEYTLILTADHGGHERFHGTLEDADMLIPLCLCGPRFSPGRELDAPSIKDIPATIARLLEAEPAREWEGKPLL